MKFLYYWGIIFSFVLIERASCQKFDFECKAKYIFTPTNEWTDPNINLIYNSLNRIDFSKIDFELRIELNALGLEGITRNLFKMTHYNNSKWQAYYYVGFKDDNRTHKKMSEFFTDSELKQFDSNRLNKIWDTLVSKDILLLKRPGIQPKSSNELVVSVSDCNVVYSIILIKKECVKTIGYNYCYKDIDKFEDTEEFKKFDSIIDYMNNLIRRKK